MMRLPQDTPARLALDEHLRPTHNKRGRPKTTWIKTIKNDLMNIINLNLDDRKETINTLENITKDRKNWKKVIKALIQ